VAAKELYEAFMKDSEHTLLGLSGPIPFVENLEFTMKVFDELAASVESYLKMQWNKWKEPADDSTVGVVGKKGIFSFLRANSSDKRDKKGKSKSITPRTSPLSKANILMKKKDAKKKDT